MYNLILYMYNICVFIYFIYIYICVCMCVCIDFLLTLCVIFDCNLNKYTNCKHCLFHVYVIFMLNFVFII